MLNQEKVQINIKKAFAPKIGVPEIEGEEKTQLEQWAVNWLLSLSRDTLYTLRHKYKTQFVTTGEVVEAYIKECN